MPLPIAALTGLAFLKEVPALVKAGVAVYDRIRNRKPPLKSQDTAGADGIQELRAAVEDIQQRLETQESSTESQAELLLQLTKHHAVLVRWLIFTAIGLALTSGAAIAALLLALLE